MAEETAAQRPPAKKSGEILGMPSWLAIAGGTLLVAAAYLMWRKHQLAAAAANTTSSSSATGTPSDYYTAGGLATDQASALYSQLVGLQGQVSNLSNTSNSVLTADQGTTSADQATAAADQGTTAAAQAASQALALIPQTVPTPAAPAIPPPKPSPPQDPNLHYTSDGSISLATLARWNNSTPARIIAATQSSEPSDVANYLKRGINATLPVGTKWNIPRNT